MKRNKYYIIAGFLFLLTVLSCGKKMTPSLSVNKLGQSYDAASFNYVYVEAIKQKLMGNGVMH